MKAIANGITILEIHMTPHEIFFGPDVSSSLTPKNIKLISDFAKDNEILNLNPRSKSSLFSDVSRTRRLFRKGVYWKNGLQAGTTIKFSDLAFLKPCQEIDSVDFENVIGKVTVKNVLPGKAAKYDDFK